MKYKNAVLQLPRDHRVLTRIFWMNLKFSRESHKPKESLNIWIEGESEYNELRSTEGSAFHRIVPSTSQKNLTKFQKNSICTTTPHNNHVFDRTAVEEWHPFFSVPVSRPSAQGQPPGRTTAGGARDFIADSRTSMARRRERSSTKPTSWPCRMTGGPPPRVLSRRNGCSPSFTFLLLSRRGRKFFDPCLEVLIPFPSMRYDKFFSVFHVYNRKSETCIILTTCCGIWSNTENEFI